MEANEPLPLEPTPVPEDLERRLWIGNLDSRLTEYHLVKLLGTIGTVEYFDFPFYKHGHLRGKPRGYCFVQFVNRNQAETCVAKLDGSKLLSKTIDVQWAHNAPAAIPLPTNSGNVNFFIHCYTFEYENLFVEPTPIFGISNQIKAIEAKLRSMEEGKELEECLFESVRDKANPIIPIQEFEVPPKRSRWHINKRYNTGSNRGRNFNWRQRTTVSVYR